MGVPRGAERGGGGVAESKTPRLFQQQMTGLA